MRDASLIAFEFLFKTRVSEGVGRIFPEDRRDRQRSKFLDKYEGIRVDDFEVATVRGREVLRFRFRVLKRGCRKKICEKCGTGNELTGNFCEECGSTLKKVKFDSRLKEHYVWDSKDTLSYLFEIFNHKDQEAGFDFHFQITGEDQVVYYKSTLDISVPALDSRAALEQNILLKENLIQGQHYVVTAEISYHGSQEIIDSITLPPVYYCAAKSIMFVTECPVRMLVTDPDDLRVGFDPVTIQTVKEIPDALYYYGNESEPELISIPNQKDGNYSATVFGIENGVYNLTCTSLSETGFLSTENFINIPIEGNESQVYIISEFSSLVVLPIFMIATLLAMIIHKRRHTR
jgi:ribosomal protein L40E